MRLLGYRDWDEHHLVFADIRSPNTVANIRHNPVVEINVVDPMLRKGYRFKGTATIVDEGARFEEMLEFFKKPGSNSRIRSVVLVKVERALPLISPAYDNGAAEEQARASWEEYWESLRRVKTEEIKE